MAKCRASALPSPALSTERGFSLCGWWRCQLAQQAGNKQTLLTFRTLCANLALR